MRYLVLVICCAGCFGTNVCSEVKPDDLARASLDTAQSVPVKNGSPLRVVGTLSMDAPEAWFTYHANAPVFSTVDPLVSVHANGLTVCAYMTCNFGACPSGSTADVASNGAVGCCGPTPLEFQIYGCASDSVDVWMSVTSTRSETARVCEAYTLDYNW